MALQGTIDTFPFADVLTLIASSSRSGRLTLTGDRGSGSLWLDQDLVVGGELDGDRVTEPQRAVFELLRFEEGSFVFDSVPRDGFPDLDVSPVPIEECLVAARAMAREWERIEALVPSSSHRVGLVPELSTTDVTIDAATWRTLVTITRSSSVGHLALELGLDDFDASVMVAALVESGLVEISDPWDIDALLMDGAIADGRSGSDDTGSLGATTTRGSEFDDIVDSQEIGMVSAPNEMTTDPSTGIGSPDGDASVAAAEFPEHFPIDDLIPDTIGAADDPWNADVGAGSQEGTAAVDHVGFETPPADDTWPSTPYGLSYTDDSPVDASDGGAIPGGYRPEDDGSSEVQSEDVLRQMSTLSPSAAEAVAATLAGEATGDIDTDPAPQRRRRGLFRTSGLFGGGDEVDRSDGDGGIGVDPSNEIHDGSGVDVDGSDGNTSISYLDSF